MAVIGDCFVDLVADERQVCGAEDLADRSQFRFSEHGTYRIPRCVQQQRPRCGVQRRFQRFEVERETALQFVCYSARTRVAPARRIGDW